MKTNVDNDSVSLIRIRINNIDTTEVKKAVILAFDDAWKSQFTFARPNLDKYVFKGSFFIVAISWERPPTE
jgi:peptidoglycan/xylan/chitin deacetylase (PgdA/CDA1 family)